MRTRDITGRLSERRRGQFGEAFRFVCVGTVATLLQLAVYWTLVKLFVGDVHDAKTHLYSSMAMTVGYVISFIFNFIASTHYTFRVKANVRRGVGFAVAHVVNWLLQMATLNLFMWLGLSNRLAAIPMFCVCIPVNFLLVRYFLKGKR